MGNAKVHLFLHAEAGGSAVDTTSDGRPTGSGLGWNLYVRVDLWLPKGVSYPLLSHG